MVRLSEITSPTTPVKIGLSIVSPDTEITLRVRTQTV